MRKLDDVIAAVATPPGTGGVAIVRVSGNGCEDLLPQIFSAESAFEHGVMRYGNVVSSDGRSIDSGYAVLFRGPRSYTGEDTVELHVHGGSVTTAQVLSRVIEAGARPAQPGEFTKRAFLNGKMDLAQAQAVGDLIGALSRAGAELARRQTGTELRSELMSMSDVLVDAAAQMEAVLEYPDEDIAEEPAFTNVAALRDIVTRLQALSGTVGAGKTIRDGLRVALAGAPNTGKSSLFNRLCEDDLAIVTNIPGTTRDSLHETIDIDGAAIHLTDTAGLRETMDAVEGEGVRRSMAAVKASNLVLFVVDQSRQLTDEDREAWEQVCQLAVPVVCIVSKADLEPKLAQTDLEKLTGGCEMRHISSVSGEGMDALRALLYERSCADFLREETVVLSDLRQSEHLRCAAEAVSRAADVIESGMDEDFACLDLKSACRDIGCVTGEFAEEEVIDRIFSKFCLGK